MKWTFMNTWAEWHSLVIGWTEAMYPLYPIRTQPAHVKKMVDSEYWYYTLGLALGAFTWFGLLFGAVIYIISIL